jgi:hypothetical protein
MVDNVKFVDINGSGDRLSSDDSEVLEKKPLVSQNQFLVMMMTMNQTKKK